MADLSLRLTPTAELVEIDGVPCRVWRGTYSPRPGDAFPVVAFVHRIAVAAPGAIQDRFRDALGLVDKPPPANDDAIQATARRVARAPEPDDDRPNSPEDVGARGRPGGWTGGRP